MTLECGTLRVTWYRMKSKNFVPVKQLLKSRIGQYKKDVRRVVVQMGYLLSTGINCSSSAGMKSPPPAPSAACFRYPGFFPAESFNLRSKSNSAKTK